MNWFENWKKKHQPVERGHQTLVRPPSVGGDHGDDGHEGNREDRRHGDQPADTIRPTGIYIVTPEDCRVKWCRKKVIIMITIMIVIMIMIIIVIVIVIMMHHLVIGLYWTQDAMRMTPMAIGERAQ